MPHETNYIKFVVDKSDREKTVLRLRDVRLLDTIRYPMESRISVKYDGVLEGLVEALSGRESRLQLQKAFSTPGPAGVDGQTQIRVDASNEVVRNVITDCIPLFGYNRIIWSSYTDGKDELPVVSVQFYGPRIK